MSDPQSPAYEASRRIKADPDLKATLIIAVSSFAMKGDEEKARASGCDAYVTKPYSPLQLLGVVRSLARRDKVSASSRGCARRSPSGFIADAHHIASTMRAAPPRGIKWEISWAPQISASSAWIGSNASTGSD
jgi:DNA-binding response OmpR family regulator